MRNHVHRTQVFNVHGDNDLSLDMAEHFPGIKLVQWYDVSKVEAVAEVSHQVAKAACPGMVRVQGTIGAVDSQGLLHISILLWAHEL